MTYYAVISSDGITTLCETQADVQKVLNVLPDATLFSIYVLQKSGHVTRRIEYTSAKPATAPKRATPSRWSREELIAVQKGAKELPGRTKNAIALKRYELRRKNRKSKK